MTIVKFKTRARFNGRWYEEGQEAIVLHQHDLDSLLAADYVSLDESQAAEPADDGADAQAPPESGE